MIFNIWIGALRKDMKELKKRIDFNFQEHCLKGFYMTELHLSCNLCLYLDTSEKIGFLDGSAHVLFNVAFNRFNDTGARL